MIFSGCSNYFNREFQFEMLEEKKIQATRKAEITKNNKTTLVIFATHVNDIHYKFYKDLEYFFIEIYSPLNEPINIKRFSFDLEATKGFSRELKQSSNFLKNPYEKDSKISELKPVYVNFISPKDYDSLFKPTNKWSKCFLVAFPKLSEVDRESIKLKIFVDGKPLLFDFSFKTLPFSVL